MGLKENKDFINAMKRKGKFPTLRLIKASSKKKEIDKQKGKKIDLVKKEAEELDKIIMDCAIEKIAGKADNKMLSKKIKDKLSS